MQATLDYVSVGCNSSANCMHWGVNGLVAFGACNFVALYHPQVLSCSLHPSALSFYPARSPPYSMLLILIINDYSCPASTYLAHFYLFFHLLNSSLNPCSRVSKL